MPSDRNRRPTEARTSGSSSMTKTVEFAADIAATRIKGSREMSLCFGSQVWPGPAVLGIPGQGTAARPAPARRTINLSMGRLNQDGTRANPRRMEQRPRRNYHFGHRQTVIEAATKEIRNEYIRRLVCL